MLMLDEFFWLVSCWILDILLCWILSFLKCVQCWFCSFDWHRQEYASALFLPVKQFYAKRPRRRVGKAKPRWVLHFVLDRFAQGKSYRQIMMELNRLYAHRGMTISLG
ncbi:hypothetical protein ACO0LF_31715, partial [Undibacterium sp. Di27W]|uniref:hypothetical protein n=1 Tax=Undibacterium sp. Di27W TaxID=3413036 RepID=UPI003BEFF94C